MPTEEPAPGGIQEDVAANEVAGDPIAPQVGTVNQDPVVPSASPDDHPHTSSTAETRADGHHGAQESTTAGAPRLSTKVDDSPHALVYSIADSRGAKFQTFYVDRMGFEEQAEKDEDDDASLLELTTVLPVRDQSHSQFPSEELSQYLDRLRENRLVLISCPNDEISQDAAYALIGAMDIHRQKDRRFLNFGRFPKEGPTPSLFFRKRGDAKTKTAILVNALGEESRPFLESFISTNSLNWAAIQDDLKQNNTCMICVIDSDYIDENFDREPKNSQRSRKSHVTHWRVPFLRFLLRECGCETAELERRILEQRSLDRWRANDLEFYLEIRDAVDSGKLLEIVAAREEAPLPNPTPPQSIFKDSDTLHNIILYVATVLPGLSPREFRRIVTLLLDAHLEAVTVQDRDKEESETPGNDLMRNWVEMPDGALRQCRLVTKPLNSSMKVVRFDDLRLGDDLLEYLQREYSLFIEQQFERLQELGLIFSVSSRVSDGVMGLIIETAAAYPDDYGARWLAEMVKHFRQSAELAGDGQRKRLIALRAAELLRRILGTEGLEGTVGTFFQHLLQSKDFRLAFEVLKRLQDGPGFDKFKWLRQLVERGDADVRQQVYGYLFSYLRQSRHRVYHIFEIIQTWFPDPAKSVLTETNKYSLRLLLAYCLETTLKFDEQLFGRWPSEFPLLSFKDGASANRGLGLLTQWLFHPGTVVILRERGMTNSIALLAAKWLFILLDSDAARLAASGQNNNADGNGDKEESITALGVRDILLTQIVRHASPQDLQRLLVYWEESVRIMLDAGTREYFGSEGKYQLGNRREILAAAVRKLKTLQYQIRTAAHSAGKEVV